MTEDNWKHRTWGMRCRTCIFFVPKAKLELAKEVAAGEDPPKILGRCRRHSPTLSGWPVVFDGDWCGDHKLDEDKL